MSLMEQVNIKHDMFFERGLMPKNLIRIELSDCSRFIDLDVDEESIHEQNCTHTLYRRKMFTLSSARPLPPRFDTRPVTRSTCSNICKCFLHEK